jgi:hypothetical protein
VKLERSVLAASILAVGVAIGGALVGWGFARGRAADRFVTVKGISEREARADLAIWPLNVVAADNDLARAHAQLETSVTRIKQFLARQQLDTASTELQNFSVSDAQTNQYAQQQAGSRFVIKQTIMVRSDKPDLVLAASQHIGELVAAGVVLSSGEQYGGGGPTFVFRGLNQLKPQMIAEATARAREAAEQFARDSHSSIAGIRRANQGVFEILPRDQARGIEEWSQIAKTIRVVSTIDYALDN